MPRHDHSLGFRQRSPGLPSVHAEPFLEWPGPGNFTSSKPLGADPFCEIQTFEIHTHEIHSYEMHHRLSFVGGQRFKGAHLTLLKGHLEVASSPTQVSKDEAIESLNLSEVAKKAAYELKNKYPAVVKFTSGLRNREDQARAMASNVVHKRHWIAKTYSKSAPREACQKWVDQNPRTTTKKEIAAGLKSVLDSFTDEQLGALSRHLSGNAFDVQPVDIDAADIKKTLYSMAAKAKKAGHKHAKFLEQEGGLERWHIQF